MSASQTQSGHPLSKQRANSARYRDGEDTADRLGSEKINPSVRFLELISRKIAL
jgi:hypothetical protein